mmetsp:Transcript_42274/g.108854  ORF Transcript_42274/g.108854 Transcript_42274/m.108854 type:complete len:155 (-) Transcript_42274:239-703(-)
MVKKSRSKEGQKGSSLVPDGSQASIPIPIVRKSLFEKVLEARVLGRSTHFDIASISKQGKAQLERQLHSILQQVLSCAVEEKKRDVREVTSIEKGHILRAVRKLEHLEPVALRLGITSEVRLLRHSAVSVDSSSLRSAVAVPELYKSNGDEGLE